jgi:hypothetical protein
VQERERERERERKREKRERERERERKKERASYVPFSLFLPLSSLLHAATEAAAEKAIFSVIGIR